MVGSRNCCNILVSFIAILIENCIPICIQNNLLRDFLCHSLRLMWQKELFSPWSFTVATVFKSALYLVKDSS